MSRVPDDSASNATARRSLVQADLAAAGFDAAVFASEANFTYLTGYSTASWAMTARPLAIVLRGDRCTAVVGSGEAAPLAAACPELEIATYTDPIVHDRGTRAFADFAAAAGDVIARLLGGGVRRVGIEATVPSASGLPYGTLRSLATALDATLLDVAPLMWRRRLVKGDDELERLARVGAALGRLYELFAERARPGLTERELHGIVLGAAGEVGVDRVGLSTVIAGDQPGAGWPTERRWERGELLLLDTCVLAGGYWADFCRHFAAGDVGEAQATAYAHLVRAVRAGREACRPGAAMADLTHAMVAHLPAATSGGALEIGRVGHGIGLDLTEPPSIAAADTTRLREGMTLTVEPSGRFPCGHLEAEEMVAITAGGARLLSPPFPDELPVLGA